MSRKTRQQLLERARAARRIQRVAYWARKAHIVAANRSRSAMVWSESELNEALTALRPSDIRALAQLVRP